MAPDRNNPHEVSDQPRVRDVLSQIGDYLSDIGFSQTLRALEVEAQENQVNINVEAWEEFKTVFQGGNLGSVKLVDFWRRLRSSNDGYPSLDRLPGDGDDTANSESEESEESEESDEEDEEEDESGGGAVVDIEAEETSNDSSDDGSESESNGSVKAGQKRKRVLTPESSSDSSSDSDSSSENVHSGKKQDSSSSSSESGSDSDSSSSGSDKRPAKRAKLSKGKKSTTDDTSSSSSDSSSDSSSSDESDMRDSDSSSESSASSESGSDSGSSGSDEPTLKKKSKKNKSQNIALGASTVPELSEDRTGSATSSSATLRPDSPPRPILNGEDKATDTLIVEGDEGITQIPATKKNIKQLKKEQVPFSRIPTTTKVDPKFSSNAYVPYDYADRAYRDLVVTKGKGFTKEKNKKKRGSYRGGAIDLAPKGIKFDD